jgi:hypothetical protein
MTSEYLLDTNIVIELLKSTGAPPHIKDPLAGAVISIITEIELLSYPLLTKADEQEFRDCLRHITILPITESAKEHAIALRRKYRLKLADALISGTAMAFGLCIITDDKEFSRIEEVVIKGIDAL